MKKQFFRIKKDEILRIRHLKNEFKTNILKSITINMQLKPILRIYALYSIQVLRKKSTVSNIKNFCLDTGKGGSVFRRFNRSRHRINLMAKKGKLTNMRTNNTK